MFCTKIGNSFFENQSVVKWLVVYLGFVGDENRFDITCLIKLEYYFSGGTLTSLARICVNLAPVYHLEQIFLYEEHFHEEYVQFTEF
jgi:hypothetical protein